MNTMNLFFDIPTVHQIDIVANWLESEDVNMLDTAVMCIKHRKELMDLLSSPDCVLSRVNVVYTLTLEWVLYRQIRMSQLCVSNESFKNSQDVEAILKIVGPTLKSLEYDCTPLKDHDHDDSSDEEEETSGFISVPMDQILYYFVEYLTHIEEVIMHGGRLEGILSVWIRSNRQTLRSIELSRCSNINSSILKACVDTPSLEKISLVNCSVAIDAFRFHASTNNTCRELTIIGCAIIAEDVASFTWYFSNLRYINIALQTDAQLVCMTKQCPLMNHAKILLASELVKATATAISQNWKYIERLEILPKHDDEPLCDSEVVGQLVTSCLYLQQLTLARPLEETDFVATVGNPTPVTSSLLRELTVSQLKGRELALIVQKCPLFHSLCIRRPMYEALTEAAQVRHTEAEFALQLIKNSNVKNLFLANCANFGTQHLLKLHNLHQVCLYSTGGDAPTINNESILSLAKQCPQLRVLRIHNCPDINHRIVLDVLKSTPTLVTLAYSKGEIQEPAMLTPAQEIMSEALYELYPNLQLCDIQC